MSYGAGKLGGAVIQRGTKRAYIKTMGAERKISRQII